MSTQVESGSSSEVESGSSSRGEFELERDDGDLVFKLFDCMVVESRKACQVLFNRYVAVGVSLVTSVVEPAKP
ncbi:hypothetical protein V2J09_011449 [Rumex salicifolius]